MVDFSNCACTMYCNKVITMTHHKLYSFKLGWVKCEVTQAKPLVSEFLGHL